MTDHEYDLLEFEFDNRNRPCATIGEACDEYAANYGEEHPDVEWISTPYDSWIRNPKYNGPRGRHPDDDSDYSGSKAFQGGQGDALASADDDMPF